VLVKDATLSLGASQLQSSSFKLDQRTTLKIDVIELAGSNIEFKVTRDGQQVFASGVHKAKANGLVTVDPGMISVNVVNENILEGKVARLSVVGFPPAAYESADAGR